MVAVNQIKPKLTLEEFLERPETKPYSEYINGKIEQKPMPQGEHSTLQIRSGKRFASTSTAITKITRK